MFKGQKGITLVALVITIIVLLILAGVSISLVVGQNGVLTQATSAVLKNKAANVREKVSMALGTADVAYNAKWAMDQSTTRSSVFDDTDASTRGEFSKQLANDGVYPTADTNATPSTLAASAVVKPVGAGGTMNFYYGGNWYSFSVSVTETGTVTLGDTITVTEPKAGKPTTEIKFN